MIYQNVSFLGLSAYDYENFASGLQLALFDVS